MTGWIRGRVIVEEKSVEKSVDEAKKNFSRFEEAWEGLKWLLARHGSELETMRKEVANEQEYFLYKSEGCAENVPSIVIVFTETADEINILAIKAYDEKAAAQQTSTVTKIHPSR